MAATGWHQILDTRPKGYWGRVVAHRPNIRPNCYSVVRLYDGRLDFPDLDSSTHEAYEIHGRDDVPLDTRVRLFRAHWGPYWTFSYGEGPGESGSGSGSGDSGSGSGDSGSGGSGSSGPCSECLARLCVSRDPYTGAITGLYYQTDHGLIAVPDCSSGPSGGGSGGGGGSSGGGGCGTCTYQWNGQAWTLVANNCTGGCVCNGPPVQAGTFVGQQITTACIQMGGE